VPADDNGRDRTETVQNGGRDLKIIRYEYTANARLPTRIITSATQSLPESR
jgi:hypothetical protein